MRFPTLSLSCSRSWTRSWSVTTNTRQGGGQAVITGTKVQQGWMFAIHNGIVTMKPFSNTLRVDNNGAHPLWGRDAREARRALAARSADYRTQSWTPLGYATRLFFAIPLILLAHILSIVLFPLYLLLWLCWTLLLLLWTLFLLPVALAARFLLPRLANTLLQSWMAPPPK